jgi:hypothetical protein
MLYLSRHLENKGKIVMKKWVKGVVLGVVLLGFTSTGVRADTLIWSGNNASGLPDQVLSDFTTDSGYISGVNGNYYVINSTSGRSGNNYGIKPVAASGFAISDTGFVFSLTLSDPTAQLQLDSVSFWSRATATGPSAYSIVVSTTPDFSTYQILAGDSLSTASTWQLLSPSINPYLVDAGQTLYFGIFATNGGGGSSSQATWRIDDLTFNYSILEIPEPSTYALLGAGAGILVLAQLRRKKA